MKLNQLLLLGATSLLVSTLPISVLAEGVFRNWQPQTRSEIMVAQKNQPVALMSGTFIAAEKPTQGTARIVNEGGHRYLEISESFNTSDQGPDLHVLLDTEAKPPQSYQNLGRTIILGKLQNYSGAQRYSIPDAINLSQYKSVVVWCRMANATFGYAPLQAASGGSATR